MSATQMTPTGRLETQLISRQNQFNLVRLVLAFMVCIDHSGLITSGLQALITPLNLFELSSGTLAVNGFFVLSGILIARSLAERGVSVSYFMSRLLRLYPALIALVLFALLVIGPLVSASPYWTGPSTFTYAIEVLHFGQTKGGPNGFYPNNPIPYEFSPPLWTLRYEFLCYMAAPLFMLFGLQNRERLVLALIGFLGCVLVIAPLTNDSIFDVPAVSAILRFAFCFGLGMLIWTGRRFVDGQLSWVAITSVLFLISGLADIGVDVTGTLWITAVILYLGLRLPTRHILKTDLSYGLYIWHYPIMQILLGELGIASWPMLLATTMPIALCVAWASWTYIERPALRLKRHVDRKRPYAKPV